MSTGGIYSVIKPTIIVFMCLIFVAAFETTVTICDICLFESYFKMGTCVTVSVKSEFSVQNNVVFHHLRI